MTLIKIINSSMQAATTGFRHFPVSLLMNAGRGAELRPCAVCPPAGGRGFCRHSRLVGARADRTIPRADLCGYFSANTRPVGKLTGPPLRRSTVFNVITASEASRFSSSGASPTSQSSMVPRWFESRAHVARPLATACVSSTSTVAAPSASRVAPGFNHERAKQTA